MATVYVSQSTANGYATGNDSNSYMQAQSKSTPFLTIDKALRASSPGDAIVVNDGTYVENTSSVGYLQANNGPYALSAQNALAVTVQASSGAASRVLHVNSGGQGLAVTGLIFDGQSANAGCVTTDSSNQLSALTFTNCQFKGHTKTGLTLWDITAFLMNGGSEIQHNPSQTNAFGIALSGNAGHAPTNNYTIDSCSIHTTGSGTNQAFVAGIDNVWPAVNGGTVTVRNTTITLATTLSAGTLYGIIIGNGGPSIKLYANTITVSGTSLTASNSLSGIELNFSSISGVSPQVDILANKITLPKGTATGSIGHGIAIGSDADSQPAGAYAFTNVLVAYNRINGGNHGILVNWTTGAIVHANTVKNTFLGLVSKLCTGTLWRGNMISLLDSASTAKALYGKGDQGSTFAMNVVVLDSTCNAAVFIYAAEDTTGPVGSAGTVYDNNILYATAAVSQAVVVDSISAATFANNNYYATGGFTGTPWSYQGTTYATFGAWLAAREATATNLATPPQYAAVDDLLLHGSESNDENLSSHAALFPIANWSVFAAVYAAPDARVNTDGAYNHGAAPHTAAYLAPGAPPANNYDIVWDTAVYSMVDQSQLSALARIPSGAPNAFYEAYLALATGGSTWQIDKVGSAGGTAGGSGNAQSLGSTFPQILTAWLHVRAGWLALQVTTDGGRTWALKRWRVDADLAAAGSAGLKFVNASGSGSQATGAQLTRYAVRMPTDLTMVNPNAGNAPVSQLRGNTSGNTVRVTKPTGVGLLDWTSGTPLVLSGGTGASITSQTIVDARTIDLVIATGTGALDATGTLWITDTVNGLSAPISVVSLSLALTAPASGIAGDQLELTLSVTPVGQAPATDTLVTISDNGAGGVFPNSGTTGTTMVLIGPSVATVDVPYVLPAVGGSPVTITLSATGSGLQTAQATLQASRAATVLQLSGPASGLEGVQSAPFTVQLPSGTGVEDPVPVLLSDGGHGGYFTPSGGTLSTGSPSLTARYTPPAGVGTVTISVTNTGGLGNPAPLSYQVLLAPDYTLDAPTDGPENTPSYTITVALRAGLSLSGDAHISLFDGRMMGQTGTWALASGGGPITQVTLNTGAPSVDVLYTPPTDFTGTLALSGSNDRSLQDPASIPYQVYDPTTSYAFPILADYAGYGDQAALLDVTVYDQRGVVLTHPTGLIREAGPGTGIYYGSVVLPLEAAGSVVWGTPAGWPGAAVVQAYGQQAVARSLSTADLAALAAQPLGTHALDDVLLPTADLTTWDLADPSVVNLLRALAYIMVNSSFSASGAWAIKNRAGTTIATIPVASTSGQTVTGPPAGS